MSTALKNGLLAWAKRIGRWIIERLSRFAANALAHYMLGKVDDFRRRLAKAKTERRREWLKGRIARWNRAANWLIERSDDLNRCVLSEFDQLAKGDARGIPMDCERLVAA